MLPDLDGWDEDSTREFKEKVGICIHIADSLHWTAETKKKSLLLSHFILFFSFFFFCEKYHQNLERDSINSVDYFDSTGI